MSMGSQGAPLVSYLDMILLRKYYQDTGTIGISKITVYLRTGKALLLYYFSIHAVL